MEHDDSHGGGALPAPQHLYRAVSNSLALLSDRQLRERVEEAQFLGSGIGGTSRLMRIEGAPVFVKRVALTDLERRPENIRSTANLFDLPMGCHYGVGSPSFGAWREVRVRSGEFTHSGPEPAAAAQGTVITTARQTALSRFRYP